MNDTATAEQLRAEAARLTIERDRLRRAGQRARAARLTNQIDGLHEQADDQES